jgi:hypothetical protein
MDRLAFTNSQAIHFKQQTPVLHARVVHIDY